MIGWMNARAAIAGLALLIFGGCAQIRPQPTPSISELSGTYYMGDGLGICMEATLHPDGSLSGVGCGGKHIGLPGRPFAGTWALSGALLHITTPSGEIGDSEAFFWKESPAFVELKNKRGNQVRPWAVFRQATR
jgi:hypothetical protein